MNSFLEHFTLWMANVHKFATHLPEAQVPLPKRKNIWRNLQPTCQKHLPEVKYWKCLSISSPEYPCQQQGRPEPAPCCTPCSRKQQGKFPPPPSPPQIAPSTWTKNNCLLNFSSPALSTGLGSGQTLAHIKRVELRLFSGKVEDFWEWIGFFRALFTGASL